MPFEGFSQATGDFIWGLTMNNDRTWFNEHREEFERHLNGPFRALTAETLALMAERYPELELQSHVSRIYRDARRLFGRGPFKDHLWFTIQTGSHREGGPVFWGEVSGTGWSYGAGVWEDAADLSEGFRRHIDADLPAFEALAAGVAALGDYQLYGESYKRPKGDRGPVVNPWYNRKHHSVGRDLPFGGMLFDPELPRLLADEFGKLVPMYRFMLAVWRDVSAQRAARLAQATLGGESL